MRGKLKFCLCSRTITRITPADAGKTPVADTRRGGHGDHPRGCGENVFRKVKKLVRTGSPPQVRGKRTCYPCRMGLDRITPAGAGKTTITYGGIAVATDHPRRCGENSAQALFHAVWKGSPPQVRGKLYGKVGEYEANRITPAGAGKTRLIVPKTKKRQDHPRRCGENSVISLQILSFPGSPPQVRGKLHGTKKKASAPRITPAGAGKTAGSCDFFITDEDHPRRCGENRFMSVLRRQAQGSPPQVRGKLLFSNIDFLR